MTTSASTALEREVIATLDHCRSWSNRNGLILTDKDGADWRPDRLKRVYSAIKLFGPDTGVKIGRLHDHSGFLLVYWFVPPTFKDRRLCEIVWGSSIAGWGGPSGECEKDVVHYVYEVREI